MLLTITYTGNPATDLGYLLHNSPSRVHSFEQVFGKAQVRVLQPSSRRHSCPRLMLVSKLGAHPRSGRP